MSSGVKTDLAEEEGFLETQKVGDKQREERDSLEEEEEEVVSSAHLEPATLPWPGDKEKKKPELNNSDEVWSEKGNSEAEERDTGISGGSQDLSEDQSQAEGDVKNKWRESMPEGERWREEDVQQRPDDHASFADDEEEEEEEEEEEWISEKARLGFTPNVMIVSHSSKEIDEEPSRSLMEKEVEEVKPEMEPDSAVQIYPQWNEDDDKIYLCDSLCSEKIRLVLATVAAGLIFPLLVWGGYALLPFDSPLLESAPLRVMYTLRCAFFAIIPVLLGVVVQGVARLRHSSLSPLYHHHLLPKEVALHWHYVTESLGLFVFYFLQLAVMATYVDHDLVKLVPLLTIIFVFGRLIYWLCLSLGSTIRAFGFGLSFLPVLVMLGVNFYYVFSSVGQGSVFDVAPPTTAPPARQRWWG